MEGLGQGRNRTRAALALASALLGLVLTLAAIIASPGDALPGAWKGYKSLLVDDSVPDQLILEALARHGISSVLAASTEPVLVSNWSALETTTLSQALARLIPGDPRRDAYLEGLGSWFQAKVGSKPYRVYYLRSSPFDEGQTDGRALSPFAGRIIYPDSQRDRFRLPIERGIVIAALALILFYALHTSFASWSHPGSKAPRRLLLRLTLVAPWLLLVGAGRSGTAIGLLWAIGLIEIAGSLDFPLAELRRYRAPLSALRSLSRGRRPPLTVLLVAFGALILSPSHATSASAAIAASASFLFGYCCLASMDSRSLRQRRLDFVPITIGRRDRARDRIAAVLCILAIISWAVPRILPTASSRHLASDIEMPLPLVSHGSPEPSMDEARTRAVSPDSMPGLPEWLVHRAFQESIPLARLKEGRADPFATLNLTGKATGGISLHFDDAWRAAAIRSIPAASIERMLLTQGGSVRGALLPWSPSRSAPLAPIEALLYIFLLVPPLRRIAAGAVATRSSPSGEIRQAA